MVFVPIGWGVSSLYLYGFRPQSITGTSQDWLIVGIAFVIGGASGLVIIARPPRLSDASESKAEATPARQSLPPALLIDVRQPATIAADRNGRTVAIVLDVPSGDEKSATKVLTRALHDHFKGTSMPKSPASVSPVQVAPPGTGLTRMKAAGFFVILMVVIMALNGFYAWFTLWTELYLAVPVVALVVVIAFIRRRRQKRTQTGETTEGRLELFPAATWVGNQA